MKGWVYKLYCKDLAIKEIYVGSSIDINARIRSHKNASHNPNNGDYNLKVYKFIRDNGGYDAWIYEILEECDVENKKDLVLNYERKYQLELDPQLNVRVEGRTDQEWRKDNKERNAILNKKYREENKDKLDKYYKEKFQCDCGGKYTRGHKVQHQKTKKHLAFINK